MAQYSVRLQCAIFRKRPGQLEKRQTHLFFTNQYNFREKQNKNSIETSEKTVVLKLIKRHIFPLKRQCKYRPNRIFQKIWQTIKQNFLIFKLSTMFFVTKILFRL